MAMLGKDHIGYYDGGHLSVVYDASAGWGSVAPQPGLLAVRLQSTTESHFVFSDIPMVQGQWYSLEVWFGDGGMRMALDGVLQADQNSYSGGIEANQEPLFVGATNYYNPDTPVMQYSPATLDDLRIECVSTTPVTTTTTSTAPSSMPCSISGPPVLLTGFESGTLQYTGGTDNFDAEITAGGTQTIDSVVKNTGNYSLRIEDISPTSVVWSGKDMGSNVGVISVRFAVRFDSFSNFFTVMPTSNAQSRFRLSWDGSGRFRAFWDGGANVAGPPITPNQWYLIEACVTFGADPRIAEWRVDGVDQPPVTMTGEPPGTIRQARFGTNSNNLTILAHYDDIIIWE